MLGSWVLTHTIVPRDRYLESRLGEWYWNELSSSTLTGIWTAASAPPTMTILRFHTTTLCPTQRSSQVSSPLGHTRAQQSAAWKPLSTWPLYNGVSGLFDRMENTFKNVRDDTERLDIISRLRYAAGMAAVV